MRNQLLAKVHCLHLIHMAALTLVMLNKFRDHAHILFTANQITSSRLLL